MISVVFPQTEEPVHMYGRHSDNINGGLDVRIYQQNPLQ